MHFAIQFNATKNGQIILISLTLRVGHTLDRREVDKYWPNNRAGPSPSASDG